MEIDSSSTDKNPKKISSSDILKKYPFNSEIHDKLICNIFKLGNHDNFLGYIISKEHIPELLSLLSNPLTPSSNILYILETMNIFFTEFPYLIPFFQDIIYLEEKPIEKDKKIKFEDWKNYEGPSNIFKIIIKRYLQYILQENNSELKNIKDLIINILKIAIAITSLSKDTYELALNFIGERMRNEKDSKQINERNFEEYLTLLQVLYGGYSASVQIKEPINFVYHQGDNRIDFIPEVKVEMKKGIMLHLWFCIGENGENLGRNLNNNSSILVVNFEKNEGKEEKLKESCVYIKLNKTYEVITVFHNNQEIFDNIKKIIKIERKTWYHLSISMKIKSDKLKIDLNLFKEKSKESSIFSSEFSFENYNEIKSMYLFDNFYGLSTSIIYIPLNDVKDDDKFNEDYGYYSQELVNKLSSDNKNPSTLECFNPIYFYKKEKVFDNLKNKNQMRIVSTHKEKESYCNVHVFTRATEHIDDIGGVNSILPIFEFMFIHQDDFVSEKAFELYIGLIKIIVTQSLSNLREACYTRYFQSFGLFLSHFNLRYFKFQVVKDLTEIGYIPFYEMLLEPKDQLMKKKNTYYDKKSFDFLAYVLINPKIFGQFTLCKQNFLSSTILNFISLFSKFPTKINYLFIQTFIMKFEAFRGNKFCCMKHSIQMFKKSALSEKNTKFDIMERGRLNYFKKMKQLIVNFFLIDATRQIDKSINSLYIFKLLSLPLSPCSIRFILSSYITFFDFKEKGAQLEQIDEVQKKIRGDVLKMLLMHRLIDYIYYIIMISTIDVRKSGIKLFKIIFINHNNYVKEYCKSEEAYMKFAQVSKTIIENNLLPVNFEFKAPFPICKYDKQPMRNNKCILPAPILKRRLSFEKTTYRIKFDDNRKDKENIIISNGNKKESDSLKERANTTLNTSFSIQENSLFLKMKTQNNSYLESEAKLASSEEESYIITMSKSFYDQGRIKSSFSGNSNKLVIQEAKNPELKYIKRFIVEKIGVKILMIIYEIIESTMDDQPSISNLFFKVLAKLLSDSRNLAFISTGISFLLNFVKKDRNTRVDKAFKANEAKDSKESKDIKVKKEEMFYETSFFYQLLIEIMFHVTMLKNQSDFYSSIIDYFIIDKNYFESHLNGIYLSAKNLHLAIFFMDKELLEVNNNNTIKKKNQPSIEMLKTLTVNTHMTMFFSWAIYQKCIFDSMQNNKKNINLLLEFIYQHFEFSIEEYKTYKDVPQSIEYPIWKNFIIFSNMLYEYILLFNKGYDIYKSRDIISDEIKYCCKFEVPKFFITFNKNNSEKIDKEKLYYSFYNFIKGLWIPENYSNLSDEEKLKNLKDELKNIESKKTAEYYRIFNFLTFTNDADETDKKSTNKNIPLCKILATMFNILLSLHENEQEYKMETLQLIEGYELFLIYLIIISTNLVYKESKVSLMQRELKYFTEIIVFGIYYFIDRFLKGKYLYKKVFENSLGRITTAIVKIFNTIKIKKILSAPICEVFIKYLFKSKENDYRSPFIEWAKKQKIDKPEELLNYYHEKTDSYSKLKENEGICTLLKDYFDVKIFDDIIQRYDNLSSITPFFSCVDKNTKFTNDNRQNKIREFKIQTQLSSGDEDYRKELRYLRKRMQKYLKEIKEDEEQKNKALNKMEVKQIKMYYKIKYSLFVWRGMWSNKYLFYIKPSLIKKAIINHYSKELSTPLFKPILDIDFYLPKFKRFDVNTLFKDKDYKKFQVPLNIRQIIKEYNQSIDFTKSKPINELNAIFNEICDNNPNKIKRISRAHIIRESKIFEDITIEEENDQLIEIQADNEESIKISDDKNLKDIVILDIQNQERQIKENDDEDNDIIENDEDSNKLQIIKDNKNDNIKFECCLVKLTHHIRGYFVFQSKRIKFYKDNYPFKAEDRDYDIDNNICFGAFFQTQKKDNDMMTSIKIPYTSILYYFHRRYFLRETGIEIFTIDNKSYYFNFKTKEQRLLVLNKLAEKLDKKLVKIEKEINSEEIGVCCYNIQKYHNISRIGSLKKLREKWIKNEMSTFEFLMWCNFFANRSYKDPTTYPVFPWPIDFTYYNEKITNAKMQTRQNAILPVHDEIQTEEIQDLENNLIIYHPEKNIRNFSLPMGMMELTDESKERAQNYREDYETMKIEIEEEEEEDYESNFIESKRQPYVYGSHYSNPMYVGYYLCKVYPFAQMKIEIQGDKFDAPSRMFLSIEKSFECAINTKCDIRELTPELFYMPEIYFNENQMEMGEGVENVDLPAWANNNIDILIKKMRKAIEPRKEERGNFIGKWIDLIFGYKQQGESAKKAFNIFMSYTYENNNDVDSLESKSESKVLMRMIELGLTPGQIFSTAIEQRGKISSQISKTNRTNERRDKPFSQNAKASILLISYIEPAKQEMRGTFVLLSSDFKLFIRKNSSSTKFNEIELLNSKKGELAKYKSRIGMFHEKYNYPLCIFGKNNIFNIAYGGLWDGAILIISYDTESRKMYQNEAQGNLDSNPIICIAVDENEVYAAAGNTIGAVLIYSITKKVNWNQKMKIVNHSGEITSIVINNELHVLGSAGVDKYINLYTMPRFHLFHSIKVSLTPNRLFISSLPIPCFAFYNTMKKLFKSFHINGKEIQINKKVRVLRDEGEIEDNLKNEYYNYRNELIEVGIEFDENQLIREFESYAQQKKNLNTIKETNGDLGEVTCTLNFIDNTFNEFLVLGMSNGIIKVRRFPDMKIVNEFKPKGGKYIRDIYIRKDGRAIYYLNENHQFYVIEDAEFSKGIFEHNLAELF